MNKQKSSQKGREKGLPFDEMQKGGGSGDVEIKKKKSKAVRRNLAEQGEKGAGDGREKKILPALQEGKKGGGEGKKSSFFEKKKK